LTAFQSDQQSETRIVDGFFQESSQTDRVGVGIEPAPLLDLDGDAPRPDHDDEVASDP
jgi:hypothetical protein